MLNNLLKFEAYYQSRKPLFWISLISFVAIGFLLGSTSGITFPNVLKNSPYEVTYLVGLLSLASIFPITFAVAETILRENETQFDAIIYALPVSKNTYLSGRIISLTVVAFVTLTAAVVGLYLGHILMWPAGEKIGPYVLQHYLWPLLVLALPNMMLSLAILCSTAWLTRNKLLIYISGLLIYILYIAGSIFSNSPLIAGSAPASPEATSVFARLDPFGMAAFFEQTRYWTAVQRNTELLELRENFLVNRMLWVAISVMVLSVSYRRFSFQTRLSGRLRRGATIELPQEKLTYRPTAIDVASKHHYLTSLFSTVRIDLASILKGIPFPLILLLWTGLMGIELLNGVSGDPRLGENFATTGIMITTIMAVLPFFAILVILFYSSELIWRARAFRFAPIENATPTPPGVPMLAKILALAAIPFFLILYSCLLAILVQLYKGFWLIDYSLFLSLFYFLGLPLLLMIVLVVVLQVVIPHKYLGLLVATVVLLVSCSSIGKMIGVSHPLLRYANPLAVPYADLNGFGNYVVAFHWQMICWGAFAVFLFSLVSLYHTRKSLGGSKIALLVTSLVVFLISASFIFYQTNIKYPSYSAREVNDWKQAYERQFKRYENFPQPTIMTVQTRVDLYPREQRYRVEGTYQLANNTGKGIDSLLIYIDQQTRLKSLSIQGAREIGDLAPYGHYWYRLGKTLRPGEKILMAFAFTSEWSPFKGHVPFNSIIGNGTFLRISNYYPALGYNAENEISSNLERQERGMPAQSPLPRLETPTPVPYDYRFIHLDAIVSTEGDQTVIGPGELVSRWTRKGRSYFRYRTPEPVPFRFAFSSARYAVRRDQYKDITIEVYYDERHGQNVKRLLEDAKKTLKYAERNFGKYPYKVVRFAEVSAFAEGFAATSYPSTSYMKEDGGFNAKITPESRNGVINELAGHELAHQWWGCAQTAPEYKEGGWVLTETLAKYTELMLFQKAQGREAVLEKVRQHTDIYLSSRSFSEEPPLYKTTYETPHLPYDKGLIVMYQLQQLVGEKTINKALTSLLAKHRYPNPPADTRDLLQELYLVSPQRTHANIDELFKQVVLYHSKVEKALITKQTSKGYEVQFAGSVNKVWEDGKGKQISMHTESRVEVGLLTQDNQWQVRSFPVENGRVHGIFWSEQKPRSVTIDPNLRTLDSFPRDNEKEVGG